jgi:SAM-dependent methyltransferase
MERWKELEFEYAHQLRTCEAGARRKLYAEAYAEVDRLRSFRSERPEDRTAGTSPALVHMLQRFVSPEDDVLEIGCGRGYTGLMLAPGVRSFVGTDVSEPALDEARELLASHGIANATIENVSALDLCARFGERRFDTAISVEVVEHLHPDDAAEHVAQVYELLRPGGKYVVVMPSRVDGPHDITREEFPVATEASGFHLNETTYEDMVATMRRVGFHRFRSFVPLPRTQGRRLMVLPPAMNRACERLYGRLAQAGIHSHAVGRFVEIRLVGHKPA